MAFELRRAVEPIVCLICIPVHILLLVTIAVNRKKTPINYSYFKLLFSTTLQDAIYCTCTIAWNIWAESTDVVVTHPVLSASLDAMIVRASSMGEMVALTAIAVNRMVQIKFALRAQQLWRRRHTVMAVVLQYSVVVLWALLLVPPSGQMTFTDKFNESQFPGMTAYPTRPVAAASLVIKFKKVGFVALMVGCSATIIIAYTLTFKARYNSKKATANSLNPGQQTDKTEIKLAVQGLVMGAQVIILNLFVLSKFAIPLQSRPAWMVTFPIRKLILAANFYTSSFIAFGMSTDLQRHAKRLLLGNRATVAPK